MARFVALVLLLACGACADATTTFPADAGSPDGSASPPDSGIEPPRPPAATHPVTHAPCPEGWQARTEQTGETWCSPWSAVSSTCAMDEAQFPGTDRCTRVGTTCPSGNFPEGLPSDTPVLFVEPGAIAGDGTEARPFGTIAAAMAAASPGTVLALSRGTFDEQVRLRAGVTLWGSCVRDTKLTYSTPVTAEAVVEVLGSGARIFNLRIADAASMGLLARQGTIRQAFALEHVVFDGVTESAIGVWGDNLRADYLVVRNTRPTSRGLYGRAIDVEGGGSVQISWGSFEQNTEVALYAVDSGTSLVLEDVAVRDTAPRPAARTWGRGAMIGRGAEATMKRTVFLGNHEAAIFASLPGTAVVLEDAIVAETRARASDRKLGSALYVDEGVRLTLRRVLLDHNRSVSLYLNDRGTVLDAAELLIRDTQFHEDTGLPGYGVLVENGATATATSVLVSGAHGSAILVRDEGTSIELVDLAIRGPGKVEIPGGISRGLEVHSGATAIVRRAELEENRQVAIVVAGLGTVGRFEDIVVRDTHGSATALGGGTAFSLQEGSRSEVRRALMASNRRVALLVAGSSTSVDAEDLSIRDTDSNEGDGLGGIAVGVVGGGHLELARLAASRNREVSVLVALPGSYARIVDAHVLGTRFRACAESTCVGFGAGIGAAADERAHLELDRFVIDGSAQCGLMVADEASLDAHRGQVSNNAIGACVQVQGYDLQRISENVTYFDNGINLDYTSLPVPEAPSVIDPGR